MKTADVVNAELNLNLGQPWIHPERHWIVRKILLWANDWLVAWWEHHFYHAWRTIPLSWKQWLTKMAWRYYFALHRRLLHRKTAIHPDASLEYHAITTIFWWARFFPVSLQRMRFSLSQLSVWTLHPFQCRVEHIVAHETTIGISRDANSSTGRTNQHHHHYNSDKGFHSKPGNPHQVEGYWIHVAAQPTEYTLFWVFGGAFLAGDALGNLGPAEIYGKSANMDVFVPTHRLAPDVTMNEILWDVHLSYQWLVQQKSNPRKIVLLGISSGGGLVLRLLQSIAETKRGDETFPPSLAKLVAGVPKPAGAVLIGPFADYTTPPPPKGSLMQFSQHDLIVTPRVLETGLPFLQSHLNNASYEHSPVHRSFHGLPPLCVVFSQHEAVSDQVLSCINQARQAGIPVTVGMWFYMCHVFTFLSGFLPEAKQSQQFICEWIQKLASGSPGLDHYHTDIF